MMALFPDCCAEVKAATPGAHCRYFTGHGNILPFVQRFELHLAGSATHIGKTPVEIVLAEWQMYDRIALV